MLFEKKDKYFFFFQIVVLMAIFAVCAANPQVFQSLFDLFNPFNPSTPFSPLYYTSLFVPPRNQQSSSTGAPSTSQQSSSTSAPSTTTATAGWTTCSGKLACTKCAGIQILLLLLLKIHKSLVLSCYYIQLLFKTGKTNNVAGIIKLIS